MKFYVSRRGGAAVSFGWLGLLLLQGLALSQRQRKGPSSPPSSQSALQTQSAISNRR